MQRPVRVSLSGLLVLLFACSVGLRAQQFRGSFTGTVTDPSGGVVPGVTVTATEIDTATTRTSVTQGDGSYTIPLLPPGRYQLSAGKAGFEKTTQGIIALTVDAHLKIDFQLKVGSQATTVTVEASPPVLDTQSSAVGTTVEQTKISQLPYNGRQFLETTLFTPGVVPGTQGSELNVSGRGGSINANGMRETMNTYLLDGLSDTSLAVGTFSATPPIDAIQEFRMETGVYSAKFGTNAGAQVNMVTKSGTNKIHGSLFEYLRNADLDTRNYFEPFVPPFVRNDYGATLGGPVVIPHVYDGHDRTFFFLAFEGLVDHHTFFSRGLVPTAAEEAGDFSALLACPQPTILIDPLVAVSPLLPATVPGNNLNALTSLLPSGTLDPVGQKVASLYPPPNIANASCGAANFTTPGEQRVQANNYDLRVDHRWGTKDSLFYRYNLSADSNFLPFFSTVIPGYGTGQVNWYTATGLDWTHTFSPTLLNEAKVGYNRWQYRWNNQDQGLMFASQLGLKGEAMTAPRDTGVPNFSFQGGFAGIGAGTNVPQAGAVNTFEYADTLTQIHGAHSLAYGIDFHSIKRGNFFIDDDARSSFSFDGVITGCPLLEGLLQQEGSPALAGVAGECATPNTSFGNGLADALFGIPTSWVNGVSTYVSGAGSEYDFFVQDDWKARRNLTFNLGLRFEYNSVITDKANHFGGFDFNTGQIMAAGPMVTLENFVGTISAITGVASGKFVPVSTTSLGSTSDNRALQTPDWHDVAPRIGFAWQPTANSKTVIRGGYGIFYDQMTGELYFQKTGNPPYVSVNAGDLFDTPQVLGGILAGAFPLGTGAVMQNALVNTSAVFPALNPVQINLQNSMVQEWSLDVQRQLPGSWLLDVGYVGTRGVYLPFFWDPNQNTPVCTATGCSNVRNYPDFLSMTYTDSDGSSIYHSLQVKLERHYANGLSFLGAYTWSKSLDTNSTYWGTNAAGNFPQNSFDRAAEKGLSDFNIPQRLSLAYVYDLPFGNKILRLNNSKMNYLIEGWQLDGIVTAQSGPPFTPTDSSDPSGTGEGTERPNIVSGVPIYPAARTVTSWMNPAAFAHPAQFQFGNAGRDILEGPGLADWDFSLIRKFRLKESATLEFRAEVFNLLNQPNFSLPASDINSPTFGQIFNTVQPTAGLASGGPGDPREIQFALRLTW